MNESIQNKIINATKWSSLTEILAKLVSPVTNIILARILVPEAFGVVATITLIISFTEMIADSGFQKYLVQHKFKNEEDKYKYATVAFWTNLYISISLWILIIIFCEQIAVLVGNPGLGNVIAIASIQIPLTSISSIQMALYRRDFDFKTLFLVRVSSFSIPFLITIPLAILGLSYWALVIGSIAIQVLNALILTLKSKWKPSFFYDRNILKSMFSFSGWSLIEAISIWLTMWIDTFIIGYVLNSYFLGIYKISITMVNTIMALITSAIIPILFSTLSRLQDNNYLFTEVYFKFQKIVSMLVFPLGVGMFLFSDFATDILLGSQWSEASKVIGIWALTSSLMIVFSQLCSEVYRSKGRPKLSFFAQVLHLIVLVPACIWASKYGFWVLVYVRAWIRMQFILVHFIIMHFSMGISMIKTVSNVILPLIASIVMGYFGYILQSINQGIQWDVFSIILCIIFYSILIICFPSTRKELLFLAKKFKS